MSVGISQFRHLRPRVVEQLVRRRYHNRASGSLLLLGDFGRAPQSTYKLLVVGFGHLLFIEEPTCKGPFSVECVDLEISRLLPATWTTHSSTRTLHCTC